MFKISLQSMLALFHSISEPATIIDSSLDTRGLNFNILKAGTKFYNISSFKR